MARAISVKLYLTIFVATTCIYMVLYQYHMSRGLVLSQAPIKNTDILTNSNSNNNSNQKRRENRQTPASYRKITKISLWPPLLSSSSSLSSPSSSLLSSWFSSPTLTEATTSKSRENSLESSSSLLTSGAGNVGNVSEKFRNNTIDSTSIISTTVKTSTTTSTATKRTKTTNYKTKTALHPPPLYIITPTYKRPEQLAELTRLGYTLKHVDNLLWLVIEDANKTSELVLETLNRIAVPYEYFFAPMPEEYKKKNKFKPRGVSNRNRGLEWLRHNATDGVFYFADDDNTYDVLIFEQMRYTKKVSMWPVGLVTQAGISTPIVRNGKIDGFYDGWIGGRKYAVDMAGFAVSVKFLHERPSAKMPFKPGYEEDGFLKSLAPLNNTDIELLASNCTQILTWHTQTRKNPIAKPFNITVYGDTNLVSLDKKLIRT